MLTSSPIFPADSMRPAVAATEGDPPTKRACANARSPQNILHINNDLLGDVITPEWGK